jgi:hypothetical protein
MTKCMVKVYLHGLMAVSTKVTMLVTRNKVMACIVGQMVENLMDNG